MTTTTGQGNGTPLLEVRGVCKYFGNVVALKAFGGPALLLVWLYVMANVIVFGAEVNWRHSERRRPTADAEEAAGLA